MGICSESDRKRNYTDKTTNNLNNKLDYSTYRKEILSQSSQNTQKFLNHKALIPM